MRTSKKLIALILSFVIFLGIAYAYWTESITFSNTVETGDFNIAFIPMSGNTWTDDDKTGEEEYNSITATLDAQNDHILKVNLTNLYPGAGAGFNYRIENKGTIPAVFDSAYIENLYDPNNLNKDNVLIYMVKLTKYNKNGSEIKSYDISNTIRNVNYLVEKFEDKLSNWDGLKKPLILEPGDYLTLTNGSGDSLKAGYFVEMPSDVTRYEDSKLSFDLVIKFKQWNAQ